MAYKWTNNAIATATSVASEDLILTVDDPSGTPVSKKITVANLIGSTDVISVIESNTNVTLAGSYDYLTISGQVITLGQIDLSTDVTGTLASGNIGSHTHVIADVTDFTDSSTNWDTAYGWGDHSTENYAVTTGDTFTGDVLFNGGFTVSSSGNEALSITRSGSSDLTLSSSGSGDLVIAHSGSGTLLIGGIDFETQAPLWNTAYGWGDHSTAGYSTSTGTVTSVATSGTVNGLTLTGGTITTSGTITLGGTLAINNADWSGTVLSAANGGTGLSSISTLLNSNVTPTSLGLLIGTNTQAWDADLDAIAALLKTDGNFIVGNGSAWVAESGATARASLGVDAAGTDNSTDVTLAGTLDYITLVGQVLTRGAIVLTTDVSGTLPAANGGTGLTSISTLLNSNTTASDVGLGSVENTALTTWVGSTAITTLGTITTGTFPYANLSGTPSTFAPSAHTLDSHSNVTITTIASGELLKWNGSAWVNNTLAEAGISATGHSHVATDVTDFDTEVSNNTSVAANTSKVTNATHTGDVTGDTALTLDATAVSGQTLVTAVNADHVLILDATDGTLKKSLIGDFASAGGDMAAATYDPAAIAEQLVGLTATQTLTNKKLSDSTVTIVDNADDSKQIAFQASGITTATTRTIAMPDTNVDLADIATNTAKVTNATHTGDVTGATALTIGANKVTLAMMDTMTTASLLGRNTAATGNVEVLSAATAKSLLSLNLVENTALSTWSGSSNVTTVGETAVTAHEGALTITESQVSDLGNYVDAGTALVYSIIF